MVSKKLSLAHEHGHAAKHELDFKVAARRNRLLGLWAAEKLGLAGEAAEALAKEVVLSDLEEPGEEDVVRKVVSIFEQAGADLDEGELREKMGTLLVTARREIEAG